MSVPMSQRIMMALVATALFSTNVDAQGNANVQVKKNVKVQFAGGPGMGLGGQMHATEDPEKMAVFLQMRIEQMKAICGLDQSQVKKLTLGGKSAARKLFAKPQTMGFGGFGSNRQLDVQQDSLSDEDSEESGETTAAGEEQVAKFKMPTSLEEVVEQPLWKKVVKSVLTEEQKKRWSDYQTKQTEKIRKLVVNHRVAELERQLYLTPDQIEEVAKIVDRVEGDQLVEVFNSGASDFIQIAMGNDEEISTEDLKNVLTETQIKVWESPGEMNGVNGMIGNLLGAAPLVPNSRPELGIEIEDGLKVKSVKKDSQAEAMGVQVGDVIDSINEEPVDTRFQLRSAIRDAEKIESIDVVRDGEIVRLENK